MGYGVISSGALIVLGLVSSVALARLYGIDVLGQFALASAPALAMGYVSSAQEQVALVRAVAVLPPRHPRVTGLFYAVLAFSALLTAAVGLVAAAVSWVVLRGPVGQPQLFGPACALLAGFVLLANSAWNLDMLLSAFRAGRELFWVRLGQALALLIAALALGAARSTVGSLVLATLISYAAGLAHRVILTGRWMRWRVEREALREGRRELPQMIRFGLKLAPGSVAHGVTSQVGTWVLGIVSSVAVVGAYNRAWMLGTRLLELQIRISEMLFPTLVERRKQGDEEGFDRVTADSLRYATAGLALPAAVGGGAAHGVMALFGPGFDAGADALSVLLLVPVLAVAAAVQSQVLVAFDRPGLTTWLAVGRMAVAVATTVPLALALGATGAALGWVLGYAANVVALHVLVRRHLSRPLRELWPLRGVAGLVAAYALGFLAARALDELLPRPAGLPVALVAGMLAFGAVLLASRPLMGRDRERLRRLGTWLRARQARGVTSA